jgi:cell division septation protein DedD
MNRISTYHIPVGPDAVRSAGAEGFPPALAEPLQALVATATRRAADAPLTIYLASDDEVAPARDAFAFALARALTAHVPSTLLVDCNFLASGLHGRVPQKDALGFLDFLLYGSSIGVITQESGGVRMVGAGSFPVTKRMPFVETAFADAARRLVTHARCALFVGPLYGEGGAIHPLTNEVDVVATLRAAPRDARLDEAEEKISAGRPEVWSLRLGGEPAPAPARAPAAEAPARPAPSVPPAPARATPPVADAPADRRYSSLLPRLAVLVFGVLVLAFVGWWLAQDRLSPDESSGPPTKPATGRVGLPAADDSSLAAAAVPATDTALAAAASRSDSAAVGVPRPPQNPADTGGRSGGTVLLNPADIHVMEDLERHYRGWYAIHISSFQESIRARDEVAFLQSREFPVFIVFLELGAKGKWYRVYAGPFATREEARDVKKNLDAVPQVRFTRITTIPE